MLCEASDAFLDLVAGRPTNPMADRLAPVGAPAAAPALAPALLVPRRSPVQAVADERALHLVGEILRFDARAMGKALTTRRIKAGGEWIESPVKPEDAVRLRDGFAKAIYAKTFAWMVRTINTHLYTGEEPDMANDIFVANKARFFVGILDIFGFENLGFNSFEQLCINYSCEVLHKVSTVCIVCVYIV